MKAIDRWELQRSSWLRSHERPWTLIDDRTASDLKRRADAIERERAGAAEPPFHEARYPPIWLRFVNRGESAREQLWRWALLLIVIMPAVALTAGVAIALSKAIYGLLWLVVPVEWVPLDDQKKAVQRWSKKTPKWVPEFHKWLISKQPLREKPWYIAAGAAGVAWLAAAWFAPQWYYPPISIDYGVFTPLYLGFQLVLGLVLTGLTIHWHGWQGVKVAPKKEQQSVSLGLPTTPFETPSWAPTKAPIEMDDSRFPEEEDDDTSTPDEEKKDG